MISPLRFYEIYTATTLHFKNSATYNAIKYNFKTRVSSNTLETHKMKYFFEKFSKVCDDETHAIRFVASNFIVGNNWVSLLKMEVLNEFEGYARAIEYNFSEEAKILFSAGYATLKKELQKNIQEQEYPNMRFLCVADWAMEGKLFKQLKADLDDGFLFEPFEKKFLTIRDLYIKCLNLDSQIKKPLVKILHNIKTGT